MKNLFKNIFLAASLSLAFTACGDDSSSNADDNSQGGKDGGNSYVLSFKVDNAQYFGVGKFTDNQKKLIENFDEAPTAGTVAYYDGSVYTLMANDDFSYSTLSRYELDENNRMPEKATATYKINSGVSVMMVFVDENKMYVEEPYGDKLTALNPKTLKKTGEVTFTPDEGAVYAAPGTAVIRDGKLYVSLCQLVDAENGVGSPYGSVAIVDIAKDKVEKVIKEDKTAYLGIYDDMNNTMAFVDEEGDIYFYAMAMFGMLGEDYKEGYVRIKKGETEFDDDYVVRLNELAYKGKKVEFGSLMTGGAYAGNGKYVALFGNFEDPSNMNNYEWQPIVIDLKNKKISNLDLEPTLSWIAPSIRVDSDGTVLLGHNDGKNSFIYRYDVKADKLEKEMDVASGDAYYIIPIK
ncbi:hypothetical protein [Fibrobacter sp.]|uniref:hypothetical protein n=1 Tax=Fibrobacter sp. TaxID=35828 RepID=UPI00386AB548